MSNELLQILDFIEKERGISRENLVNAIESAILTASRKSIHPASELRVKLDPHTGAMQAWANLEVVEANPNDDQISIDRVKTMYPDAKIGDHVEWEVTPSNFGRIAAQTAKQAILQQLRRAEKENVQDEFSERIGTIINGTVRRFEAGSIIIDFTRAEGIMSSRDKVPGEQYQPGERINALLREVDISGSGPSLIVSRSCNDFVRCLFEREVSEIHDGVVEIKAIARDPGVRSKVAVFSNDSRIDPVGACVGVRGNRVRNITAELGNERVDIVPWSDDIRQYAINALSPAKVQSIELDEENRTIVAWVTEEQSKLAFGKKGQNVQLSGRLIGCRITIKNVDQPKDNNDEKKLPIEEQMRLAAGRLSDKLELSPETAALLVSQGYVTCDGVKEAGETLLSLPGVNTDEIKRAIEILNA